MDGETLAGVTSEPGGEYYLIAQEVESAEYRRRVSSTYTKRNVYKGRGTTHGQEACIGGAMIHKAAVK